MLKVIINQETGAYVNLDKGNFDGDQLKAKEAIESYTSKHPGSYNAFGHGYGELTLGREKFDIDPYGIDIGMMLKWCHIAPSTVSKTASNLSDPSFFKVEKHTQKSNIVGTKSFFPSI